LFSSRKQISHLNSDYAVELVLKSIFSFPVLYIHNAKCTPKGHCGKGTGKT